jgi:hypothetical protein
MTNQKNILLVLIPATSVSICAASDRMANEFDMYPPTISIQTMCVKIIILIKLK